jgi:hypothetical protein
MNQLQALAMNEGYHSKNKLFSEQGRAQLENLALAPSASRRRQGLSELLDRVNPTIEAWISQPPQWLGVVALKQPVDPAWHISTQVSAKQYHLRPNSKPSFC